MAECESFFSEEEPKLISNLDNIKLDIIELEEYKFHCTENGSVDSKRPGDESKIGHATSSAVEPQVHKELVIRLEKLDYSTLAKSGHNPNSFPRKVCEHCGKSFPHAIRLAQHRVKEHGSKEIPMTNRLPPKKTLPRNFHCDQCDKSYHLQTMLAIHKANVHKSGEVVPAGPKKIFKHFCKHCGKNVTSWIALVYHLKFIHEIIVDESKSVQCMTCRARFISAQEMAGHICNRRTLNKKDRSFKCDLCDNAYFTKVGLEAHFSVHPEYHHCKCDQCPMGFFNERELGRHMILKHKVKGSFECETCGKQFKTQEGWTRHQEDHANDRQLFCCEHCGKKYKNHAHFRAHKYNVHAEHVSEIVPVEPMIPCPICEKVYKRRVLVVHMRIHNEFDRKFKCTFASCDKSFNTKFCLKTHVQSHTKDYKFKCKFCEYGTVVRHRIVKHEQKKHNYNRFANEGGSVPVKAEVKAEKGES